MSSTAGIEGSNQPLQATIDIIASVPGSSVGQLVDTRGAPGRLLHEEVAAAATLSTLVPFASPPATAKRQVDQSTWPPMPTHSTGVLPPLDPNTPTTSGKAMLGSGATMAVPPPTLEEPSNMSDHTPSQPRLYPASPTAVYLLMERLVRSLLDHSLPLSQQPTQIVTEILQLTGQAHPTVPINHLRDILATILQQSHDSHTTLQQSHDSRTTLPSHDSHTTLQQSHDSHTTLQQSHDSHTTLQLSLDSHMGRKRGVADGDNYNSDSNIITLNTLPGPNNDRCSFIEEPASKMGKPNKSSADNSTNTTTTTATSKVQLSGRSTKSQRSDIPPRLDLTTPSKQLPPAFKVTGSPPIYGVWSDGYGPPPIAPPSPHDLTSREVTALRQLIRSYRESAGFLLRAAEQLETSLHKQPH